ncbi:Uncharacterised protein [Mycobacteroides abscessus subsp. bolletii]|nr:Uncharacterised protein [Mycobacteroides abscessus subsp. bolletii]SKF85120.1 Uncharacterised protein [Mycobacteroides abscessus subsp. bolletii]SKG61998.1 Uncharacterised protein [Mycobacteroides abscessus subsp. bolletii]SKG68954.1 Uncharacterised protein [Mycobacteroides abscessus subsp. bolletii]SKG74162.1 Uncharacterised protein [Mycobacteroides abscessus subsp. bolletii]
MPATLYIEKTATAVTCPRCRTTYGVNELRDDMRARARDQPMTGADMLRMIKLAGEAPPPSAFYRGSAASRRTSPVSARERPAQPIPTTRLQ